ncbi:MAG: RHS repeat-associated core domain-containing protein, partial [Lachnospiraceae bacterium]|nr:RHS repeat-associated core domain-containing protein [Lachnospiraceae bacterium]
MMNIGHRKLTYAYDGNGNITSVTDTAETLTASYQYDERNQLVRENNLGQKKTFVYTYDAGGNLTSIKEYAYTTGTLGSVVKTITGTYATSGWKDKLTAWNGNNITYDAIGNMLTKGTGTAYTWTQGRKLAKVVKGGVTSQYQYDHAGMRVKKTVGSTVTDYRYAGRLLISEKTGNVTNCYRYDSSANLIAVTIGGTLYFYVKNLQGDIIGLVDESGNTVVEYKYDSWGNLLNKDDIAEGSVGAKNPFRYRGYYYDAETGMYYLESRYYDPEIRRFISMDDIGILFIQQENLLQYNQYAYCFNNPVNYVDVTGYIPQAVEDKWVHNQVLNRICTLNTDLKWKKTCIYYNGENIWNGWGY